MHRYRKRTLFTFLALLSSLGSSLVANLSSRLHAAEVSASSAIAAAGEPKSDFPWRRNIVTTYFWIGQGGSSISATTNVASAWDAKWTADYGGIDDPARHVGFCPSRFAATENPFYVALPFNDVAFPELAKKYCPWYKTPNEANRYVSQCKGHWIEIRNKDGRVAFAQWQDVGPLRTDHASYVFGDDRPHDFNHAGLDVSPAIHDYLGLTGLDLTDWRFVDADAVPDGPWRTYGEQAVIYAALKQKELQIEGDWHPYKKSAPPSDQ